MCECIIYDLYIYAREVDGGLAVQLDGFKIPIFFLSLPLFCILPNAMVIYDFSV